MEKNRSTKIIAIAALFIAVIGLSIGFAAFSSTLTINSSATVTPDESQWKVGFVFSDTDDLADYATSNAGTYSIANNVISNPQYASTSDTIVIQNTHSQGGTNGGVFVASLGNLKAHFTAPGQSITYKFYVKNEGATAAYLKSIKYTGSKSCGETSTGDGNSDLITAACNALTVSTTVKGTSGNNTASDSTAETSVSSNGMIAPNGVAEVNVTIDYAAEAYVDTPIEASFKNIELYYDAIAY